MAHVWVSQDAFRKLSGLFRAQRHSLPIIFDFRWNDALQSREFVLDLTRATAYIV
jgi:hypothetical protein